MYEDREEEPFLELVQGKDLTEEEVENFVDLLAASADATCDQVVRVEELESSLDELVGCIVHRIKGPLTPVKGYAQLALLNWNNLTEETKREMILRIVESTNKVLDFIDTNLSYFKGQIEGWSHKSENIPDLSDYVGKWVENWSGCHEIDFYTPLNPVSACADIGLVEEIVAQLVENAEKYKTPNTRIQISLTQSVHFAAVEVINEAPARSKPLEASIFDPLTRGKSSAKGHGFGLYIARKYAQAMGGDVNFTQYTPAEDVLMTRFSLWIPIWHPLELLE